MRIRDVLKCREWFANAMAAVDDVIITADNARFIERFGWRGVESSADEAAGGSVIDLANHQWRIPGAGDSTKL